MSEQVTEKVTLTRLDDAAAEVHYRVMEDMPEDDVDDYEYANALYRHTDGTLYKKCINRYETGDFVQVTNVTPTMIEFITSYYNGGCYIDEIIEGVLKEMSVERKEWMGS